MSLSYFFFNDTAPTEIYTFPYTTLFRSGLPEGPLESCPGAHSSVDRALASGARGRRFESCCARRDRKSTRLNSSHMSISYAVFCLKKKKKIRELIANSIKLSYY